MNHIIIKQHIEKVVLVSMLGLSTILFLWGNYCSLGYTFDSFHYLDIANHITIDGFWNNEGFNFRPPAYPVLIHLVGEKKIIWVNLLCLWVSFTIIYYFGKEICNLTIRRSYYILICLATPIYLIHSFVWTEPLFTSFLLLAFYGLHQFFQVGKPQWLIVSLMAFLLLPSIRLAGTFISLPIFFWLLLNLKTQHKKIVLSYIILFSSFSLMWMMNFKAILSQGSSLLSFHEFFEHLTSNSAHFLDGISLWLTPRPTPFFLRLILGLILLINLAFVSISLLTRKPLDIFSLMGTSFIIYYLALHPYFHVTYYTAERYLAPMYPLLFLPLFKSIDQYYSSQNHWVKKGTMAIALMLFTYSLVRVSNNLSLWHNTRCANDYQNVIQSEKANFERRYEEIKRETLAK